MLNDKRVARATNAAWVALSGVCVGDQVVRFMQGEVTPLHVAILVGVPLVWILIFLRANAELHSG